MNHVIYDDLVTGQLRGESRSGLLAIIHRLMARGAVGAILGCTEIPLLVREADVGIPLFDTTRIHAEAALTYACETD